MKKISLFFGAIFAIHSFTSSFAETTSKVENTMAVSGTESLESQLAKTILPKIDFDQTSFSDAMAEITKEAAAVSHDKIQLHFISVLPKDFSASITLRREQISVAELLKSIGQIADVNFVIRENEIVMLRGPIQQKAEFEKIHEKLEKAQQVAQEKFHRKILAKIDLDNVSVRDALAMIDREISETSEDKVIGEFTWTAPESQTPDNTKVTLHLKNVSPAEAFDKLAEQLHCGIGYEHNWGHDTLNLFPTLGSVSEKEKKHAYRVFPILLY